MARANSNTQQLACESTTSFGPFVKYHCVGDVLMASLPRLATSEADHWMVLFVVLAICETNVVVKNSLLKWSSRNRHLTDSDCVEPFQRERTQLGSRSTLTDVAPMLMGVVGIGEVEGSLGSCGGSTANAIATGAVVEECTQRLKELCGARGTTESSVAEVDARLLSWAEGSAASDLGLPLSHSVVLFTRFVRKEYRRLVQRLSAVQTNSLRPQGHLRQANEDSKRLRSTTTESHVFTVITVRPFQSRKLEDNVGIITSPVSQSSEMQRSDESATLDCAEGNAHGKNSSVSVAGSKETRSSVGEPSGRTLMRRMFGVFAVQFVEPDVEAKYRTECFADDEAMHLLFIAVSLILSFAFVGGCLSYESLRGFEVHGPLLWMVLCSCVAVAMLIVFVALPDARAMTNQWLHVLYLSCVLAGLSMALEKIQDPVARGKCVLTSCVLPWMCILDGIAIYRPRWFSPIVMYTSQALAFAALLAIQYHYDLLFNGYMTTCFVILICASLLFLFDFDSHQRQSFAVSVDLIDVRERLCRQYSLLEHVLGRLAPLGVASDLIRHAQSVSGRQPSDCLNPDVSTNFATASGDIPVAVFQFFVNSQSGDAMDQVRDAVAAALSRYVKLQLIKCTADLIMFGSPREPSTVSDDFDELRCEMLLRAAFDIVSLLRTSGYERVEFRAVLCCGQMMGAVLGHDSLSFEYYGGPMAVGLELLRHIERGSVAATDKFYHFIRIAGPADISFDEDVTEDPSVEHNVGVAFSRPMTFCVEALPQLLYVRFMRMLSPRVL